MRVDSGDEYHGIDFLDEDKQSMLKYTWGNSGKRETIKIPEG